METTTTTYIIEKIGLDIDLSDFSPETNTEQYKLTIPSDWIVEFGPPVHSESPDSQGPFCVRIYEPLSLAHNNLTMRSLIFNVVGFHVDGQLEKIEKVAHAAAV